MRGDDKISNRDNVKGVADMSINWGTYNRIKGDLREDKYYKDAYISEKRTKYYDVFVFLYAATLSLPYIGMMVIMYFAVYHISKFWFLMLTGAVLYFFVFRHFLRFVLKRRKAVKYFRKIGTRAKVTWLTSPYKNIRRPSGKTDIKVETTNYVFYIMLFPSPKKAVQLMFTKGKVSYITRFNRNRFRIVFNVKKKVRTVPFVFECTPDPMNEKHVYKMVLLCPTPNDVFVPSKNDQGGVGSVVDGVGIHNMDSAERLFIRDIEAESQFY